MALYISYNLIKFSILTILNIKKYIHIKHGRPVKEIKTKEDYRSDQDYGIKGKTIVFYFVFSNFFLKNSWGIHPIYIKNI